MTLLVYKILAAILIFIVTYLSVLYPLRHQHAPKPFESISMGEALASGIFLGVAFFHMLPDALKIFAAHFPQFSYPIPEAICVSGFLLLLFLERIGTATQSDNGQSLPYFLAALLTIHALIEGAALGVGANFSETLMIFIAVFAHKFSESFALCVVFLRHKFSIKKILVLIFIYSLMTPLGILFGTLLNQLNLQGKSALLAGAFDAFAAGTFIYVSTLHHIHAHQHRDELVGLQEFAFLFSGVTMMAMVAVWA